MKRKAFAVILFAVLAVLCGAGLAACDRTDKPDASPSPSAKKEYFTYSQNSGGTYTVTGLTADGKRQTELTIPAEYDGKAVTAVGENAFYLLDKPVFIEIPHTVEKVESGAFFSADLSVKWNYNQNLSCTNFASYVKELFISKSVTEIEPEVFLRCSALSGITVDSENQHFSSEGGVLYDKDKTEIFFFPKAASGYFTVPDGVTKIGYGAFSRSRLTSVTLPEGVRELDSYAFYDSHITVLTLPASVESIGADAFSYNESLSIKWYYNPNLLRTFGDYITEVIIPDGTTVIPEWGLRALFRLTAVTIPDGVARIGRMAFDWCTALTEVSIPKSVEYFDGDIFGGCENLTAINVAADNPNYLSRDGVVYTKSGTRLVCVPAGTAGEFTIPDGITEVRRYAFYTCGKITSVTVPASVLYINEHGFDRCGMSSVIFAGESALEYIGYSAFTYCPALETVEIPDGVQTIDGYAFWGAGVTTVKLPASALVRHNVFLDCGNLTIYVCGGVSETPPAWHEDWNPDNRPVIFE